MYVWVGGWLGGCSSVSVSVYKEINKCDWTNKIYFMLFLLLLSARFDQSSSSEKKGFVGKK